MNAGTDKSIHLLIAHTYDVARIAQLAHTGPEKRLLQMSQRLDAWNQLHTKRDAVRIQLLQLLCSIAAS